MRIGADIIKEVKMSNEIFHVLVPVIIALFIFWLLYRIKRRLAKIIKNKIIDEFPHITDQIENFQKTIEYFNSRLDLLEHKVNELEKKE